jgi:hypothetical protein
VCGDDLRRVSYESHEVVYCPTCQTGGKVLADRPDEPAACASLVGRLADHLRPDPEPQVTRGLVARVREHLVDVTPLRMSPDFRRLFHRQSISEFGDEVVAVAVAVHGLQDHPVDPGWWGCSGSASWSVGCSLFPIVAGRRPTRWSDDG